MCTRTYTRTYTYRSSWLRTYFDFFAFSTVRCCISFSSTLISSLIIPIFFNTIFFSFIQKKCFMFLSDDFTWNGAKCCRSLLLVKIHFFHRKIDLLIWSKNFGLLDNLHRNTAPSILTFFSCLFFSQKIHFKQSLTVYRKSMLIFISIFEEDFGWISTIFYFFTKMNNFFVCCRAVEQYRLLRMCVLLNFAMERTIYAKLRFLISAFILQHLNIHKIRKKTKSNRTIPFLQNKKN